MSKATPVSWRDSTALIALGERSVSRRGVREGMGRSACARGGSVRPVLVMGIGRVGACVVRVGVGTGRWGLV